MFPRRTERARAPVARLALARLFFALAVATVAVVVVVPPARAETPLARADRVEAVTAAGRHVFTVEVVDTDETRARGLMFRTQMAPDAGMLFDFRTEQPVWFWMKNTYLPLDMIFARADGTIRAIAADATPLSEATVPSGGPVRFVLELNAGTAARIGLKPGDKLVHPRMRSTF